MPLNIRADTTGLSRLQGIDAPQGPAPAPVAAGQPAGAAHRGAQYAQAATANRPRPERRKGERRKQNLPVLLDTRSRQDRRRNPDAGTHAAPTGVDTYA